MVEPRQQITFRQCYRLISTQQQKDAMHSKEKPKAEFTLVSLTHPSLYAKTNLLNQLRTGTQRFAKATTGLVTYIDDNAAAILDYGGRRRCADPISTAFVEATVNLVVGNRFAKKERMQWSKAGAHLLLQTLTQTLDGTLREMFRKWYPAMAANDVQMPAAAA
jgi:hypothetical protein